jgi:hypothetical protein
MSLDRTVGHRCVVHPSTCWSPTSTRVLSGWGECSCDLDPGFQGRQVINLVPAVTARTVRDPGQHEQAKILLARFQAAGCPHDAFVKRTVSRAAIVGSAQPLGT